MASRRALILDIDTRVLRDARRRGAFVAKPT
jgi:hypothetical protein